MGSSAKTIRFSVLVDQCGPPELVTLWEAPGSNKAFQKALAEHRVMTIKLGTVGTKKDMGLIGFVETKNASYLIFPKSLREYEGRQVVGIKYELLATSRPKGPLVKLPAKGGGDGDTVSRPQTAPSSRARTHIAEPREPKPIPQPKRFRVTVRISASLDVEEEVEAENKQTAKKLALDSIARRAVDFSNAATSRKVVKMVVLGR
jgi:hypothetical protein